MKRLALVTVLSVPLFLLACAPEGPEAPPPSMPRTAIALSSDGVAIEYDVRGSGPLALVFIHGWICDRAHWRHQVDVFDDEHTVVTLDLAGHGNSGIDRSNWTIHQFGADVQAVVEALDLPRVILVGHSMGGQVALDAAARMPDRVLGVVGADTLHNVEKAMNVEGWSSLMARYEADFAGTCEQFAEYMFPEPTDDAGLADWVQDNMCDADPVVAVAVGREMPRIDQPAMLAALAVPVRCINSTRTAPTDVEANRRHGDYDAVLMDDVGHFVMLERPEEFNWRLADAVEELTGAGSAEDS
jgi:sigma-B regulation protein RsbQ